MQNKDIFTAAEGQQMKHKIISTKQVEAYGEALRRAEKSGATIEKYLYHARRNFRPVGRNSGGIHKRLRHHYRPVPCLLG